MKTIYHFDPRGGFIAEIENTNIVGYAYRTSPYAVAAKRNPAKVAATMIASVIESLPAYVEVCGYDAFVEFATNIRS